MLRTGLVAAVLAVSACAPEDPIFIETQGRWADGEAIDFRADARVMRHPDGRIDLRAVAPIKKRFLGVRLSYDSTRILAPGKYAVDTEPVGKIELYCLRPDSETPDTLTYDTIEYEVNSAEIVIDSLPGVNGKLLEGTFSEVVLERKGQPILRLQQGRFRAQVR